MKLHHIGIATGNIAKTKRGLKKIFGAPKSESQEVFDPSQQATVSIMQFAGGTTLELISGEKVKNVVSRGISFYHLCLETEHIEKDLDTLQKNGALLVSPPKHAPLFHNRRVAFLYTAIGLIELLERK